MLTSELSPKERIIRTIELKEIDKIPVDFGGYIASVIDDKPYGIRSLYKYLELNDYSEPIVTPTLRSTLNIDERVIKRMGTDLRHVFLGGHPLKQFKDGTYIDSWGRHLKQSGSYISHQPQLALLRDAKTVKEINEFSYWPDTKDSIYTKGVKEQAKAYTEAGYAVCANLGNAGMLFHLYAYLRGFDKMFLDMKIEEELFFALADKIFEVSSEVATYFFSEVGDYIDIVLYCDDMGMQSQPLLSIEDYRKHIKPYSIKWVKHIKKLVPGIKVLYHTCGSIYDLIPDFIEVGVDILNPIQPLAHKMDPYELKKNFGDKICFHGGIDIQRLLNLGTPEQIKEKVRELMSILGRNGGWILAPAHNIQADTPPENIVALYDAAKEYGAVYI